MRALINGVEGGTVVLFKTADAVLPAINLIPDNGGVLVLTGGTATLEIFSAKTRTGTVALSAAAALTVAAAGHITVTLTDTQMTFGPGTYYAWVKFVDSGSLISYSLVPFTLEIR